MPPSESEPGASEDLVHDPVDVLLESCLDRPEGEWTEAVAAACCAHPDKAARLRARLAMLEVVGFASGEGGLTAPAPTRAIPDRIGDFRILSKLATGGMGVVYLAEQESLGRSVALKLIRPEFLDSEQARRRFRREVELASRLDHPGLCTVYEAGEVDGQPYIAMQHVPGTSLAERFRSEKASGQRPRGPALDNLLALVETVARALHAAHETGLVHRDVKPENILIGADGKPVVVDFGLAFSPDVPGNLTVTGDVLGTPVFMSPEQVTADGEPVDQRTDVYSLGITLYQGLTGRLPFEAHSRATLYREILDGDVTDPRHHHRAIPRDLGIVTRTAMDRDPGRRYATCLQFAEDLANVRARRPIRARRIGVPLRLQRWIQRHPAHASAITLLFVGLVVTMFLLMQKEEALLQKDEALREAAGQTLALASREALAHDQTLSLHLAVASLETLLGSRNLETARTAIYEALAQSRERHVLAHNLRFVIACDDGNAWIFERRTGQKKGLPHGAAVHQIFYSSKGESLLTIAADGSNMSRNFRGWVCRPWVTYEESGRAWDEQLVYALMGTRG